MKKQLVWILCIALNLQLTPLVISANQNDSVFDSDSLSLSSEASIATLEKALPAVVLILTKEDYFEQAYGSDPSFFYKIIRPFYEWKWPSVSGFRGTGFFISEDGYIATNEHVIGNATEVLVAVQDGILDMECRIMKASIVGKDPRTDIAVLKIDNNTNLKFPHLSFGNSNHTKIGEPVMAIGNPYQPYLEATVTTGIISAKNRNDEVLNNIITGYLQTDASINGGNSGGPLINLKGEVIGINVRGYCWYGFLEGLGFAIPSHTAKHIVQQLISNGKISQGFLGVELDQTKAETFDLSIINLNNGALVKNIIPNSPAKQAGLENGDLILKINEYSIKSAQDLKNQVYILEPDTNIDLTVNRQGKKLQISLKLGSDDLSKKYFSLGYKLVI